MSWRCGILSLSSLVNRILHKFGKIAECLLRLDELQKTDRCLAIACSDKTANIGFEIMADYLDGIFQEMTSKQADVIVLT